MDICGGGGSGGSDECQIRNVSGKLDSYEQLLTASALNFYFW